MQTSPKYLIHADIRTSGVVERSDVVGAIFGQTEGLLGDELDLRDLQEASKVGRIDVEIDSEGGRSFGTVTIASALDRVETSVLAAALETIGRVGPCRAECTVTEIEDARAAKRRELVDRATELLGEFEETALTSDQLVEEVRQRARVEDITTFEELPAGPRVADSDAIIIVEGRADVRQLLQYGIKNAIAVEGTDISDALARLTRERTVTAFLDGDRGGDLVLRELAQVGNVDYVAFAPTDQSVEDLDRTAIMAALRKKIPYEQIAEGSTPREAFAPTDGGVVDPTTPPAVDGGSETEAIDVSSAVESDNPDVADVLASSQPPASPDATADVASETEIDTTSTESPAETDSNVSPADTATTPESAPDAPVEEPAESSQPETLAGHVEAVLGAETVRLLDDSFELLEEAESEDAFDCIADAEDIPESVALDGELSQRVLDVAAQRGVSQIVATSTGQFVKQPTSVRIRTADDFDIDT